jgi:predicted CXXCH cytochrome family protein
VPIYSTSAPQFGYDDGTYQHGLAGGNFYWVRMDHTKGHNVFLGEPDDNLSFAPGDPETGPHATCGGNTACHVSLSNSTGNQFGFSYPRQGCTKCHMIANDPPKGLHHLDDSGIVNSAAQGWYRFLAGHETGATHGVAGIEDDGWQANPTSSDHNEYLGIAADKTKKGGFANIGDTMTAYCTGCHGNFHIEQSDGAWIRHPSDAVIPNRDEYADAYGAAGSGTGMYDPVTPVARPVLSSIGDSSEVRLDIDMVMCLSCHRPHGSPYPDMLRWDYDDMDAGSGNSGGCFTCHTQKN